MKTVDGTGRSMAEVARRARRQAEKVNDGFGARLHVALQRRLRTYFATPRTADAAAIDALDTLANPTNASYRRHLSLILTVPPVASRPLTLHSPCNDRYSGSEQRVLSGAVSTSPRGGVREMRQISDFRFAAQVPTAT